MSRMKQILNKLGNFLDHSKVFHILLLSISILTLIGLMYLTYLLNEEVDLSNLDTELMKPTIIYDEDNEEASKITANKMEGVSINEVPEHVIDAVLSIEDHRFYEHHGIDVKGIIRAAFENLFAGGIVQGGSTITQQLAKNTILTPEKTYERKIKEVVIASQIEQQYSKDEILEMYLNQIYFGHGAWGIQNASRVYFGKNVEDVTLAEAAMLAGLIHSPSALDPYKNFESAKKRQGVVLSQMKAFDEINEAEYEKALVEDIQLKELSDPLKGKYPYYVDQVIYEAVRMGLTERELIPEVSIPEPKLPEVKPASVPEKRVVESTSSVVREPKPSYGNQGAKSSEDKNLDYFMKRMKERVTYYHNQNSHAEVLDKKEVSKKAA